MFTLRSGLMEKVWAHMDGSYIDVSLRNVNCKYCSHALKSRSKLKAAIGLRAAFGKILLDQNSSLCTVTFGEKILTLAKSRGS